MRTSLVLLLSSVSLVHCAPEGNAPGSRPGASRASEIVARLAHEDQASDDDAATTSAYVTKARLSCGSDSLEIAFTKAQPSTTVYRVLDGCTTELLEFARESDGNVILYRPTGRTAQSAAVFEASLGGAVLDTVLVRSSVLPDADCGPCKLRKVTLQFVYSELLSEEIALETKIDWTDVGGGGGKKEKAPRCRIEAKLVCSKAYGKEIELIVSQCKVAKSVTGIELAIVPSDASRAPESLHAAIDEAGASFDPPLSYRHRFAAGDEWKDGFAVALRAAGGLSLAVHDVAVDPAAWSSPCRGTPGQYGPSQYGPRPRSE